MMKNIILGALAGAAIAYLIVEKKNSKSIEQAYDHVNHYLISMKKKMKEGLKRGKHSAEYMGDKAAGVINGYMHR